MISIEDMLYEDYKKYSHAEDLLNKELKSLPTGSITTKIYLDNIFYTHQYYENGKRLNKSVAANEAIIIRESKNRRLYIKEQLRQIDTYKNYIIKKYPHIVLRFLESEKQKSKTDISFKGKYKKFKTAKGDMVRSKSEVIIANAFYMNGINYEYEKPLPLERYVFHPDFTISHSSRNEIIYWEHCGMMDNDEYLSKWNWKRSVYERNDIIEWKNLIVTYETSQSLIDLEYVQNLMKSYL